MCRLIFLSALSWVRLSAAWSEDRDYGRSMIVTERD